MNLSRRLLGGFLDLPRSMWALFVIQVVMRGGDFVFPFLTLFLTRKLGLSGVQAGFWVTLNVASGLLGTMVAGKVGDHLGRRRVLAACMLGTALITGTCGLLPPTMTIPHILVLACFFQGSMKPMVAALIMDLCPPLQRKEAYSLSYLGVNLGVAVGPMAAGFLFEHHLPWTFFGNAVALTCCLAVLARFVPETAHHELAESEREVAVGAWRAFLDRPLLVIFCVVNLFVSFAYAQTTFGLTLYTAHFFGAGGAAVFGFLMSLNAITVLATTTLLTRLTRSLSMPTAMAMGTALYTLGFAMLAFPLSVRLMAFSTIVWTTGEVLQAINTGAYLADHTPVNLRGRFQSIRETLSSAGRIASPMVFGAIITSHGVRISWALVALVTLFCTAGFGLLHAREAAEGARS